jgi:hypothetical protein
MMGRVALPPRLARLLAEPTVHFFAVAAILFVAHRIVVGDPRVIMVTAGVKADLARRFRDRTGRAPSPSELDGELRTWKRDEALYREALRDRLDRDDAAVRTVLADRARARAALGTPMRHPSDADLDRWLETHRSLYERPRRYDYETVAFSRAERAAPEQRERYEQSLKRGADARSLGRPIVGGNLTGPELQERVGPGLAARIQSLPVGEWHRIDEGDENLLLARLNAVEGGLPDADELRKRLVADWSFDQQQRATDEAVQAIVDRYRFEERQ